MHALGDGVLMGAGEGGEDQLACVGLSGMDVHARHPFVRVDELGHVGKIKLRVDAQSKHIHSHGDDIDVARPLAVAEQRPFDAVRPGQEGHFRVGYARAAVVMRMDGQDDVVAVFQVLRHIGDLGGEDVRHGHLHRRRQVDDGLAVSRRLPYVQNGVAHFQGVFRLGTGKAFRRIFETVVGPGFVCQALEQFRAVDGNLLDFFLGHAEDLLPLGEGRRVVDVDDGVLDALQGLEGLADDVLASLCQYLDSHVIRNHVVFDEVAQEFVFRFRRCREAYFDFLKAHGYEGLVKFDFFIKAHRNDEGLVAVAQIDAAPHGGLVGAILICPRHIDDRGHVIPFFVMFYVSHTSISP